MALDLLTHDLTAVATGINNNLGLAVDIKNKKVYFGDRNRSISRKNLDVGSAREVILKNTRVGKMAIDWIGQRIFFTKDPVKRKIFVANMDFQQERTLLTTKSNSYGIALDPIRG